MKRGLLASGMLMVLGNGIGSVSAQEAWRPAPTNPTPTVVAPVAWQAAGPQGGNVARPAAPPVTTELTSAGVSLGRPAALPETPVAAPLPVYGMPLGLVPINFPPPGPPLDDRPALSVVPTRARAAIVPVRFESTVLAVSTSTTAAAPADDTDSDFATDRTSPRRQIARLQPVPETIRDDAVKPVTTLAPPLLMDSIAAPFHSSDASPPAPATTGAPVPSYATPTYATPIATAAPIISDGIPDADPLHQHFYVQGEYLLWTTKRDNTPPLVTTSTNPNDGGVIIPGNTTTILFGGGLDRDPYQGARLTLGFWMDMWCSEALEVSGFWLPQRSADFSANSNQFPVIGRPFFDVNTQAPSAETPAQLSKSLSGSITVHAPSDLWGIETNARWNCCNECNYRLDFLGGLRLLHLGEGLEIDEASVGGTSPQLPARFQNQMISAIDRFTTDNYFIGAQLGLDGKWRKGPWTLGATAKIAVGGVYEETNIEGGQRFVSTINGANQQFVGGLLAESTNIGHHRTGNFGFVPEVQFSLAYQLTQHIQAKVGYDFLYWLSVERPGGQIDYNLDESVIPNFNPNATPVPGGHPQVLNRQTDFWAQGLTVALEFKY